MQDIPITDAERQVMEALWEAQPLLSGEIIERVRRSRNWSPKTIRTLLGRLARKGMIEREWGDGGYLHRSVLDRDTFLRGKSRHLVDRLFRGRVAPLVAAFAESRSLSEEDLRELRALLDSLESRSAGNDEGEHD